MNESRDLRQRYIKWLNVKPDGQDDFNPKFWWANESEFEIWESPKKIDLENANWIDYQILKKLWEFNIITQDDLIWLLNMDEYGLDKEKKQAFLAFKKRMEILFGRKWVIRSWNDLVWVKLASEVNKLEWINDDFLKMIVRKYVFIWHNEFETIFWEKWIIKDHSDLKKVQNDIILQYFIFSFWNKKLKIFLGENWIIKTIDELEELLYFEYPKWKKILISLKKLDFKIFEILFGIDWIIKNKENLKTLIEIKNIDKFFNIIANKSDEQDVILENIWILFGINWIIKNITDLKIIIKYPKWITTFTSLLNSTNLKRSELFGKEKPISNLNELEKAMKCESWWKVISELWEEYPPNLFGEIEDLNEEMLKLE